MAIWLFVDANYSLDVIYQGNDEHVESARCAGAQVCFVDGDYMDGKAEDGGIRGFHDLLNPQAPKVHLPVFEPGCEPFPIMDAGSAGGCSKCNLISRHCKGDCYAR